MEISIPNYRGIVRATPIDRLGGTYVTRFTCTNPRRRKWNKRYFKSFEEADRAVYASLRGDVRFNDSRRLWDTEYTGTWKDRPASQKQLNFLSAYIEEDLSDLTKGEADDLIDYIISDQSNASKRPEESAPKQAVLAI